jgi:hypothetical protein
MDICPGGERTFAWGTGSAPRFRDAVALHETIDTLGKSAVGKEPK